jgi:hypothetical protein
MIVYDLTAAKIAEMAALYMPLTIAGLDDKEGFQTVRSARLVVKGKRVAVEKRRQELKADALSFGRKVDARAKELTELLLPIEGHLEAEEGRITAERERLKREAEEAAAAKLQARVDALTAVQGSLPVAAIAALSESEWTVYLDGATKAFREAQERAAEQERINAQVAEAQRIAEELRKEREAEARAAEEKRLTEVRAEQERVATEQAEQAAALKAERERIVAEAETARLAAKAEEDRLAAERQKLEDDRKRAQDEAEAARLRAIRREEEKAAAEREAAEKIRREAEEAARREEEERAEAARQEALRPDREKLRAFANALLAVQAPVLSTQEAQDALQDATKKLLALTAGLVRAASVSRMREAA